MTALTMTTFAKQKPLSAALRAAFMLICLAGAVATPGRAFADSAAQAPAAVPPQMAQTSVAPGAAPAAAPTAPQQPAPNYQPGFLHQLKIWWDDSVALFDRKDRAPPGAADAANKRPEDSGAGVGDKARDAAASSVTTSQDAMKGAVEATRNAASSAMEATKDAASTASDAMKGAVEATKDAASAIVRLPNTRVLQVNEVCARAPNGGADCSIAATTICRAKGFSGGAPLDVRTGSRCDPKPPPQAGQMPAVHCTRESAVTRVVCQ